MSNSEENRFSSSKVATHLVDICGVSTSRQAVEYALKSDRKAVHKNQSGYKLMAHGIELLTKANTKPGVKVIDGASPFGAKTSSLKEVLRDGYQTVSICDPYVDVNTLDVLYKNLKRGATIKILTVVIKDVPQGTLSRLLNDLRSEGFDVEIRVYKKGTLHDRYLITEKQFVLSGNSLNYLGNKESFLVTLGEDIRQSMLATFNAHWKASTMWA